MDPPPPSQSQQTPKSTIFTNPDGTPIRIFTQADLLGRGKVLKELRLNGAELSSDATNAQIMLVDPSSRQGRLFIDDWGQDSNRTVLNSTWVKKSIAAGRPLLDGDEWGDCWPHEEAFPPTNGEGDDDILDSGPAKSPLPTPRVTPEERAKMRAPTVNAKRSSVDMKSYTDDQSLAALTPPPIATNNNPTDMMAFQPQPQPGIPSIPGMNPFMFMQNSPAMSSMSNMPGSMMNFAQAMLANMMMPSFMPNQQQIPSDAFRLALQDSFRNQVMGWPSTQSQPGSSTENQPISPLQEPPLPYPMVPSISNPMGEPESFLDQPFSSEFVSENSMRKSKGKEKAYSPSYKRRKISSSSAKTVEKYDMATSSKVGTPSQGTLFTNEAGQPLRFYVQVDIHGRGNLLSMIKKNGGTIVGEAASADYAVLSAGNKRQKVYKSLLSVANSAGVPAIQAKFISECVSENELLDSEPFMFESQSIRKRKRSMSTVSVESEDEDHAENREPGDKVQKNVQGKGLKTEREPEVKKPITREPGKASKVSAKPTKYSRSYPRAIDGPRTPTPPPDHTRETWGAGFRFSQAENDFALRYAKILIDRDHEVSQSVVTSAIHKTLPHHSLSSWRTHFTSIASSEWETWRKRAGIAFRKAQSQKEAEAAANVASALLEVQREMPVEDSPSLADLPNGNHNNSEDIENDINAVVRFFVEGNDNDETEDEHSVWNRLAQQNPCRTEGTWEIFYEKHAQEVIDRFNKARAQK